MTGGPIIAIVDDDASVRRALLRVVQSGGYRGQTFASARELLAWLPHGQAACLVLDVDMDELSGLDVHDRLKVPTVHLRKPFDRASVLAAIRRTVGGLDGPHGSDHDEGGES